MSFRPAPFVKSETCETMHINISFGGQILTLPFQEKNDVGHYTSFEEGPDIPNLSQLVDQPNYAKHYKSEDPCGKYMLFMNEALYQDGGDWGDSVLEHGTIHEAFSDLKVDVVESISRYTSRQINLGIEHEYFGDYNYRWDSQGWSDDESDDESDDKSHRIITLVFENKMEDIKCYVKIGFEKTLIEGLNREFGLTENIYKLSNFKVLKILLATKESFENFEEFEEWN